MSDITEAYRSDLSDALQDGLDDQAVASLTKKVRSLAEDIVESVEMSIKDNLAQSLSYHVREMAGRAVNAMLEGNETEMVRWLNGDSTYTGRDRGRAVADNHPVIHGKLFEYGGMQLRRKIVEAHRDIITSERIADLESQLASVVAQRNIMESERDEARQRLRDLL